jgi:hypothetical protein
VLKQFTVHLSLKVGLLDQVVMAMNFVFLLTFVRMVSQMTFLHTRTSSVAAHDYLDSYDFYLIVL